MDASPRVLSSAPLPPPLQPSASSRVAPSADNLAVGITLIAMGVLFGGALIAGGAVLLARTASMPIHTNSLLSYKVAYGLTGSGILALGGFAAGGGIFLHDHHKGLQRIKQREHALSQLTEMTITNSMLDDYLYTGPQPYFDIPALLDDISRLCPQLKKLKFSDWFYTVNEGMVSHLPATVEELDLPAQSKNSSELLKILETICRRLPLLKMCTLKISQESMTEDVLKSLSSLAFGNNSKMECLILCSNCALNHPPIPTSPLESHLGPEFEARLVTTRPDLNYITHQYTITKKRSLLPVS